ncbi:hypothetical protein E4U53_003835 [Claviceps sorghi]|nr:hypothetical protein E4U53_003835 [Claviceps sorghi]
MMEEEDWRPDEDVVANENGQEKNFGAGARGGTSDGRRGRRSEKGCSHQQGARQARVAEIILFYPWLVKQFASARLALFHLGALPTNPTRRKSKLFQSSEDPWANRNPKSRTLQRFYGAQRGGDEACTDVREVAKASRRDAGADADADDFASKERRGGGK